MTTIRWTDQAVADLAAIRAFIEQDSPHYASVVVARLIRAVDQLRDFPQSGRVVPEFKDPQIHDIILKSYRIVYRVKSAEKVVEISRFWHGAQGAIGNLT